MSARAALARAKVNLCLHVVGRRPDGRHLLESMVVFPETGDLLRVAPAETLSLSHEGRFARFLPPPEQNLVLRAAEALRDWAASRGSATPGAALTLEKRLPIASGVGGGSSDAATALRLLAEIWSLPISDAALAEIGLALGADLPVCLAAPRPMWMGGIGERLSPLPALPGFWLALVNPGVEAPTGQVFAALERRDNPAPPAMPSRLTLPALEGWLDATRNDLQAPAIAFAPVIQDVIEALGRAEGCLLARMSGSGATCFGMFARQEEAEAAVAEIAGARREWWAAAAPVGQARDAK